MRRLDSARLAEWIWRNEGGTAPALRALLAPASWAFAGAVSWRNRRFDRAWARPESAEAPAMPLPALSIGNLSVGGTGKTPVAAWFAQSLLARGATPAIVMRGYGDDEWRVHQLLTPAVRVIRDPDRVRGAHHARALGADVVVLDDAFQHRRARRVADVVLLSADQWAPTARMLPAGPYREGFEALRRASCVIITVKAEHALPAVDSLLERVSAVAPQVPFAVVRLVPDCLRRFDVGRDAGPTEQGLREAGQLPWGLVSGIGDPGAFAAQLAAAGLRIGVARHFPDHFRFTAKDVARLLQDFDGLDRVVCTLKDAVKLGPLWPPGALPLWYVSQTLVVERGAAVLGEQVDRVLSARSTTIPTSG